MTLYIFVFLNIRCAANAICCSAHLYRGLTESPNTFAPKLKAVLSLLLSLQGVVGVSGG